MKDEIYKEALAFAEEVGYKNESEKDKLIFDFTTGANFVMKKVFEMTLVGDVDFCLMLHEKRNY